MKLSDSKHKLTCFVIMTLFPFHKNSVTIFRLILFLLGLYWPNFSLVFLIRLFLYAGVYCTVHCNRYVLPAVNFHNRHTDDDGCTVETC